MSNKIKFGTGNNFLKPKSNRETQTELLPFDRVCRSLPQCSSYLVKSVLNPVPSYFDILAPSFKESSVEHENFLSLKFHSRQDPC